IGTPGSANRDSGIVIYSSNLGFDNTDLRGLLSTRFKQMIKGDAKALTRIFVENDANAAAYGEMLAGAAKDYDNVVVVTLGTGVGGGIIIDGKIYSGFNFYGAEIGHNVIEYGGRPCPCGRNGCLESYASATALIKSTKEAMLDNKDSKLWEICDNIDDVNGKTAFDAMRLGDAAGKGVVDEYINYLGCGLVNIVNTFQPQMLLIGGGVCKEGDYLTKPLEDIIARESYKVSPEMATKLAVAKLGNDAGIIGAAFLYKMSE
ncbi:MAG: ROK family protein, partial [Clostridiales bacterium]|nr:ROK family protein [Clostridiales bacterium]